MPVQLIGVALSLAQADWVAIFPSWFEGSRFMQSLEPVEVISIPPQEYTISARATGQATLVIYRHNAEAGRRRSTRTRSPATSG